MSFDKDPLNYSLLTYGWVVGISLWGGIAGYARKVNAGLVTRFSILELLGELMVSSFVGLVTFWGCESANIDSMLSAVLIAISAHMGSRAIFMIETKISSLFDNYLAKNRGD
jgi:hypothetical protein